MAKFCHIAKPHFYESFWLYFKAGIQFPNEWDGFWLGLNDNANEGQFALPSNGKVATYLNFFNGQPDNAPTLGGDGIKGENCVYMKSGIDKQWNDFPCSPIENSKNYPQQTFCEKIISSIGKKSGDAINNLDNWFDNFKGKSEIKYRTLTRQGTNLYGFNTLGKICKS